MLHRRRIQFGRQFEERLAWLAGKDHRHRIGAVLANEAMRLASELAVHVHRLEDGRHLLARLQARFERLGGDQQAGGKGERKRQAKAMHGEV